MELGEPALPERPAANSLLSHESRFWPTVKLIHHLSASSTACRGVSRKKKLCFAVKLRNRRSLVTLCSLRFAELSELVVVKLKMPAKKLINLTLREEITESNLTVACGKSCSTARKMCRRAWQRVDRVGLSGHEILV